MNQSQTASCAIKLRSAEVVKIPTVVNAAPTMVTNMTGFLIISRGLSFVNESPMAGPTMFQSKREGALWVIGRLTTDGHGFTRMGNEGEHGLG